MSCGLKFPGVYLPKSFSRFELSEHSISFQTNFMSFYRYPDICHNNIIQLCSMRIKIAGWFTRQELCLYPDVSVFSFEAFLSLAFLMMTIPMILRYV